MTRYSKKTPKLLAKTLGPDVRVNAVAPGFIESKMTEALPEDVRDKMLAAMPLKRFGSPAGPT